MFLSILSVLLQPDRERGAPQAAAGGAIHSDLQETSLNKTLFAALAEAFVSFSSQAANTELNLYSARHYQTDEALYKNFPRSSPVSGSIGSRLRKTRFLSASKMKGRTVPQMCSSR